MNKRIVACVFLAACALQAMPAAAAESKWRVSATGGLLDEKDILFTTVKENVVLGIEIARKLGSRFELGADISHGRVKYETTIPFFGTLPEMEIKNTFFLLSLNFRPVRSVYVGLMGGAADRSLESSGPDNINMAGGAFGVKAGYDLFLSERFSVGAQFQRVSVGEAEKTVTSGSQKVTYKLASTSFTKFLLAVGYRF